MLKPALAAVAFVILGIVGLEATGICATAEPPSPSWQFAVISDVHVYPSGKVPPGFKQTVAELVRLKPRLVIIDGDSTSGNLDDQADANEVNTWWNAIKVALEPLHQAGIPVLPVAGNHDYYRAPHRQGFLKAWNRLTEAVLPLALSGNPPRFYSFDIDGVHFTMLHVVDQLVDADVAGWLKQDLASPSAVSARLRFAFGHVPLKSVMGHSSPAFAQQLGTAFIRGGVSAYIAGHEHLIWDEVLRIQGKPLRQITVGTASGSYTFPLNEATYAARCQAASCTLPASGIKIQVDPSSRLEKNPVTLLLVDVNSEGYSTRFMAPDPSGNFITLGE